MAAAWRASALAIGFAFAFAIAPARADLDDRIGQALFERNWVPAPASTASTDGLGPQFDGRACSSCHLGAARSPLKRARIVRLGDANGRPDPIYGRQLNRLSVQGIPAEARLDLAWTQVPAPDLGLTMLKPDLVVADLAFGPLAPGTAMSLRQAPGLAGLGLLEQVPVEEILSRADPEDRDRDGVRGRPNWVSEPDGARALGRFGWKASTANVADQTAKAFLLDMGLSTPLMGPAWGDCTLAQGACTGAPQGGADGGPELNGDILALVVRHVEGFPAPRRRAESAAQANGRILFAATGCAACHVMSLTLADGRAIQPFTDLLLHDMGDGLADPVGEGEARGRDWRTAPLWGLGGAVSAGAGLLHDGRAASVLEAIAWHDGEAAGARARFAALDAAERQALIAFLESL